MKSVMVVGKLSSRIPSEVSANIKKAAEVCKELWSRGVPAICPHTNTGHWYGELDEPTVRLGYLYLLRGVDGVVLLDGWEESEGAQEEVYLAIDDLGLRAFFEHELDEVEKWSKAK